MPLYRVYSCPDCRTQATTGLGQMNIPLCGSCRGPMKWQQTREYRSEAHVPRFGQAPALDYNQTKGRIAPIGDHGVEVNSLRDMRRIERESEQAVRDGVPGAQLHVFRKYSQDRSNMDANTLGPDPSQGPSAEWLRKNGSKIGSLSEAAFDETSGMGPSMTEENASYLPHDPI